MNFHNNPFLTKQFNVQSVSPSSRQLTIRALLLRLLCTVGLVFLLFSTIVFSDPANANDPAIPDLVKRNNAVGHRNFIDAKKVLPQIFQGMEEDFYCGCQYTGKIMNLESCGYEIRKQAERAQKLEWEHVIPAWALGHQLQCWQNGGRKACQQDARFNYAEGDLHNLVPSIGEVNGDRSNYGFGAWTRTPQPMYGACQTIIDFKTRQIQPRDEIRGRIARIAFYMSDRHQLQLSRQDKQLYCNWNMLHPVDEWEIKRNLRIERVQGNSNRFITDPNAHLIFCE